MKILFKQNYDFARPIETELSGWDLKNALKKTREALEVAYSGFDNSLEIDLIDSYIYEINALQKRYQYLADLAAVEKENEIAGSRKHSPIRALVSHVFS
ncbi:MAG: YaaL family protein [Roseburia sp.]|nr:YaaL family protein [Roseburia sp.]